MRCFRIRVSSLAHASASRATCLKAPCIYTEQPLIISRNSTLLPSLHGCCSSLNLSMSALRHMLHSLQADTATECVLHPQRRPNQQQQLKVSSGNRSEQQQQQQQQQQKSAAAEVSSSSDSSSDSTLQLLPRVSCLDIACMAAETAVRCHAAIFAMQHNRGYSHEA